MIVCGSNVDVLVQAEATLLGNLTGTLWRGKTVNFTAKPTFAEVRRRGMNRQGYASNRLYTEQEVTFTKELRLGELDKQLLGAILASTDVNGVTAFLPRAGEATPSMSIWTVGPEGTLFRLSGFVVERLVLSVRPREAMTFEVQGRAAACTVAPLSPGLASDEPLGSLTHLDCSIVTPATNLTDLNIVFESAKTFTRDPRVSAVQESVVRVTGSYSHYVTTVNPRTMQGTVDPETVALTVAKANRVLQVSTTGLVWADEPTKSAGDFIRQVNFEPQSWTASLSQG